MITLRLPDHFPVRATEWMLAGMKMSFGFILLLPYPIFDQPMLAGLARMLEQRTWGWIGFIAGFLHLIALYVNGTRRKSPHVRAFCSFIGVVFWVFVCRGMYAPGVPTTGWAIYPWLVVFGFRNIWTAMEDARRSDERYKSEGATGGNPSVGPEVADWILSAGAVLGAAVAAFSAYRKPPKADPAKDVAVVSATLFSDKQLIMDLLAGLKGVQRTLETTNDHLECNNELLEAEAQRRHDEAIIREAFAKHGLKVDKDG